MTARGLYSLVFKCAMRTALHRSIPYVINYSCNRNLRLFFFLLFAPNEVFFFFLDCYSMIYGRRFVRSIDSPAYIIVMNV